MASASTAANLGLRPQGGCSRKRSHSRRHNPDNAPTRQDSISATLRHRPFRALIGGGTVYFVGNAMQAMATAWLMVELTGSSFLAALVQTAVFLPMFLLALPAGVMADTTDRARMIVTSLWVQMAVVLLLTFVAGCCTALITPAWNSMVGEILPRERLPQAIVT